MKKALLKKRYGIPAALIAILAVSGIAVATLTYVLQVKPKVFRPVSERTTMTCDVPTGGPFVKGVTLDLALPAPYDLTYTLCGDTNDYLANEKATIELDLNNNGAIEPSEPSATIALNESVTFTDINGVYGQLNQNIQITGTARDGVLVGIAYAEGNDTPQVRDSAVVTNLYVEMVPTKA